MRKTQGERGGRRRGGFNDGSRQELLGKDSVAQQWWLWSWHSSDIMVVVRLSGSRPDRERAEVGGWRRSDAAADVVAPCGARRRSNTTGNDGGSGER
ncbi:hypothetical protein L1987_52886 [Smallanthus sonchifolius]|uniref:Uncharacterized protein n=1 Tax=Smallanthus sonchifolius TaxID=185202 RepID=A0ACB9EUS9_9ASTR|nr:hypothetical protein L1987_52886 [Smallanthus sonchifolius]